MYKDKMKTGSVKKNFAYQVIYDILAIILPFITSPYVARIIGAEGLGTYSYTYSIAYYFVLFSMLGIVNYGNRAIAQVRDDREELNQTFSSIMVIHIVVALFCFLGYCIYIYNVKADKIYVAIQGLYVLSAVFDISWFYFGIEKFKLTVTRNTIIKLLNVICIFVFVKNEGDLWKYCLIMALGALIGQLSLWIPLKQFVSFKKSKREDLIVHFKSLFILFIPAIAVSLYKYMDKIMIGMLSGKAQLGFYENAEKFVNMPLIFISSFATVMLPKMSYIAVSQKKDKTLRYIEMSMQFILCLSIGISFGVAGISKVFAPVFWGVAFSPCGKLIMGLAVTLPFVAFANVIRTQYLIPYKMDKQYLVSVIVGALVNLIINFILIPKWGAMGATIATIIAEIVVCFIQSMMVKKELPLAIYIKSSSYFLCVGSLMFLLVWIIGLNMREHITTVFVQIFCGACFYGVLSLVYFYWKKNEVLLDMISKIRDRYNRGA